ncbi:MAG: MBL fold metallo-hydrolase [Deltaproteobacteria bacterium]|nr:MBL fold metallo-hydrolase [Deltaproteobacteria bacterium]
MRFSLLASGSGGNACYVETNRTRILIDAGLSCREIERRLTRVGVPAERLDAIVLTHEHSDHIRGAGPLARRYNLPLYTNSRTLESGQKTLGALPKLELIETGGSIAIEDLFIETFTKCHDASDPIGLILSSNGVRIGLATDLGRSTRLAEERLKACQALILEFNYDPDMLNNGPYPLDLKRRIKGPDGHLSNQQGGKLLKAVSHRDLELVVLAHLSETNNDPDKARRTAARVLGKCGLEETDIVIGRQDEPGPLIELGSPY